MDAQFSERGLAFQCCGETLIGVIAMPTILRSRRGVLIAVGGPQYRIGSHRQFVLLARYLAAHGIASMRFDYRGMGDSSGAIHGFEVVGEDFRAAVDTFMAQVPALDNVVLWGLCDAASASLFYAHRDQRVSGLVLLNPWARTQAGEAKAYLKHYYLRRVIDPKFWKKAVSGQFDVKASLVGVVDNVRRLAAGGRQDATLERAEAVDLGGGTLPERMAASLERFAGHVLLILSGNDLTAKEFLDACQQMGRLNDLMSAPRVTRLDLRAANHTFSTRVLRDQVAECTRAWVMTQ